MIEAIIFDFDGVILESMSIKSMAFAEIYNKYGDEISKIAVEYHEQTGGMPRYDKIKYLHKKYLGIELNDKELEKIDKLFSDFVMSKIIYAPFIKGVEEFIYNNYKKYKMFVSSGTPLYELEKTIKIKNLEKYFVQLYGSPKNKTEHISEILQKFNLFPQNVVFIGDGLNDKEYAEKMNIHFIARITENSQLRDEKNQIKDFSEINPVLQKINLSDLVC